MENYIKKAADAFLVERPYEMRVDYRKKGFVLFNRNLNVLGNAEHDPSGRTASGAVQCGGDSVEVVKLWEEHAGFNDVFFLHRFDQPLCRICKRNP